MSTNTGWFDSFRDNGGPVLYSTINRTAAVEDVRNVLIYISFSTLFVAFLIILPGIRKERLSTFISVTVSLLVGAVILIAIYGTSWHVAEASISSPYRAFSKEKIFADIGVRIGLQSVNITLKAKPLHRRSEEINYNERFYWIGPTEMKKEFQTALAKGLPYTILTIAEYLSQDSEGFCWGRSYRLAGYYSSILLWVAFSTWILMNLLLCAVPRYGAYTMQITGVVMLLANALYALLLPHKPLMIPFEGGQLTFVFGWCFWMVLAAGVLAVVVGAVITLVDVAFPNKFSTILEVDYDTPYRYFVGNDAHLIGANGLVNGHTCQHAHHDASATSSSATASTCCGPPLSSQSSSHSNGTACLAKTKSDASTSTSDKVEQQEKEKDKQPTTQSSNTVNNITTKAEVEKQAGIANQGYLKGDEEDGDVTTTIIDGKRAVSIHNFGKFAAQQQKEGKSHAAFRNRNSLVAARRLNRGISTPSESASVGGQSGLNPSRRPSQIQVDLTSAAAMW